MPAQGQFLLAQGQFMPAQDQFLLAQHHFTFGDTSLCPSCSPLLYFGGSRQKREKLSLIIFFSPLRAALQVVFHPINPTRFLIEVLVCININQSLRNMEGQGQAKSKRVLGTYSDLFLLSSPVAEGAQIVFAWCVFIEFYW